MFELADVPLNVDPMQFALFHTASFAFRCMTDSLTELERLCEPWTKEDPKNFTVNSDLRISIFKQVWTIIEYADTLRQACDQERQTLRPTIKSIKGLTETLNIVRELRNKKVHFPSNAKNYAKQKKFQPPHGFLKCFYMDEELKNKETLHIFVLSLEPRVTETEKMDLAVPEGMPVRAVLGRMSFVIHHSAGVVNLSDLIHDLKQLGDSIISKLTAALRGLPEPTKRERPVAVVAIAKGMKLTQMEVAPISAPDLEIVLNKENSASD